MNELSEAERRLLEELWMLIQSKRTLLEEPLGQARRETESVVLPVEEPVTRQSRTLWS
jgi:hypothetical protein